MRKKILFTFAVLSSLVLLLAACGNTVPTEETPTETVSMHSEPTESVQPAQTEPAPTETEPTETPTEPYELIVWETEGPGEKVTLSGNPEEQFLATDFCYVEGESCMLMLEKDIVLPGDFVQVVDAIICELEELTGLKHDPEGNITGIYDACSGYYGFNPWPDFEYGKKIPIFIIVDREDVGYISSGADFGMYLLAYELYSEEFWNSVSTYRYNPWRREDHIRYIDIAHELTHVIQGRNATISSIMTEGSAEYFSGVAIQEIARQFDSVVDDSVNAYEYALPEPITAENAERIFVGDYAEISHAQRGAEYTFGKKLCAFLQETYGDSFYGDYIQAVKESNLRVLYGFITEEQMQQLTDIFKQVFGETVFEDFGRSVAESVAR